MLSVILPTYNEKENIRKVIRRILKVFDRNGIKGEVVVVDDNSPDGTWKIVENISKREKRVRLLRRVGKKGLASAVLDGVRRARGNIICVMDADLSHPPETIPDLLNNLGRWDMVVASRYVKGGKIEKWSWGRRILSRVAALAATPLSGLKDPLSGFFLFRKSILKGKNLKPKGFKICLEILVRCSPRVREIPYTFSGRKLGKSKLSMKEILNFLLHISSLYIFKLKSVLISRS